MYVLGRRNDITVFVRVQDLGEVGGHGVCILSNVDLRETDKRSQDFTPERTWLQIQETFTQDYYNAKKHFIFLGL